jgi:hypothetical protein
MGAGLGGGRGKRSRLFERVTGNGLVPVAEKAVFA